MSDRYVSYAESCNRRFHPRSATWEWPYWYFCRLVPGHPGPCDGPAVHLDAQKFGS